MLLITGVATGYAFTLAFAVHGAPDQARIAQFAQDIGRSWWTVSQISLTVPLAIWASRGVRDRWQGALVGVALIIVAGWIGAALPGLVRRRRLF